MLSHSHCFLASCLYLATNRGPSAARLHHSPKKGYLTPTRLAVVTRGSSRRSCALRYNSVARWGRPQGLWRFRSLPRDRHVGGCRRCVRGPRRRHSRRSRKETPLVARIDRRGSRCRLCFHRWPRSQSRSGVFRFPQPDSHDVHDNQSSSDAKSCTPPTLSRCPHTGHRLREHLPGASLSRLTFRRRSPVLRLGPLLSTSAGNPHIRSAPTPSSCHVQRPARLSPGHLQLRPSRGDRRGLPEDTRWHCAHHRLS